MYIYTHVCMYVRSHFGSSRQPGSGQRCAARATRQLCGTGFPGFPLCCIAACSICMTMSRLGMSPPCLSLRHSPPPMPPFSTYEFSSQLFVLASWPLTFTGPCRIHLIRILGSCLIRLIGLSPVNSPLVVARHPFPPRPSHYLRHTQLPPPPRRFPRYTLLLVVLSFITSA